MKSLTFKFNRKLILCFFLPFFLWHSAQEKMFGKSVYISTDTFADVTHQNVEFQTTPILMLFINAMPLISICFGWGVIVGCFLGSFIGFIAGGLIFGNSDWDDS